MKLRVEQILLIAGILTYTGACKSPPPPIEGEKGVILYLRGDLEGESIYYSVPGGFNMTADYKYINDDKVYAYIGKLEKDKNNFILSWVDKKSRTKNAQVNILDAIPIGEYDINAGSEFVELIDTTYSYLITHNPGLAEPKTLNWYLDGEYYSSDPEILLQHNGKDQVELCLEVYHDGLQQGDQLCNTFYFNDPGCQVFYEYQSLNDTLVEFSPVIIKHQRNNYFWDFGNGDSEFLFKPISSFSDPDRVYEIEIWEKTGNELCKLSFKRRLSISKNLCAADYEVKPIFLVDTSYIWEEYPLSSFSMEMIKDGVRLRLDRIENKDLKMKVTAVIPFSPDQINSNKKVANIEGEIEKIKLDNGQWLKNVEFSWAVAYP